jgi:hypothetical protein
MDHALILRRRAIRIRPYEICKNNYESIRGDVMESHQELEGDRGSEIQLTTASFDQFGWAAQYGVQGLSHFFQLNWRGPECADFFTKRYY